MQLQLQNTYSVHCDKHGPVNEPRLIIRVLVMADLVAYFARELDDETKEAIIDVFNAKGTASHGSMAPYFEYYRRELKSSVIFSRPPVYSHEDALHVLELLKANATVQKTAIPASDGGAAALDLGVRAMLVTACKSPGTFGGDVFNPVWKTDETLAAFVDRVYPRWTAPVDNRRNNAIAVTRMSAHELTTDGHIRIEWTDRLTDHLELLVGADWKTIYIFRYPCYLKMCLKALLATKPDLDHTTAEALALYVHVTIPPSIKPLHIAYPTQWLPPSGSPQRNPQHVQPALPARRRRLTTPSARRRKARPDLHRGLLRLHAAARRAAGRAQPGNHRRPVQQVPALGREAGRALEGDRQPHACHAHRALVGQAQERPLEHLLGRARPAVCLSVWCRGDGAGGAAGVDLVLFVAG